MKHPIYGYGVHFVELWTVEPVFHAEKPKAELEGVDDSHSGIYQRRTRCGLVTWTYNTVSKAAGRHATTMPVEHALRFGRPCRRCFPDAAA